MSLSNIGIEIFRGKMKKSWIYIKIIQGGEKWRI